MKKLQNQNQSILDAHAINVKASDFSNEQITLILSGIDRGLDVSIYANPSLPLDQMTSLHDLMVACDRK